MLKYYHISSLVGQVVFDVDISSSFWIISARHNSNRFIASGPKCLCSCVLVGKYSQEKENVASRSTNQTQQNRKIICFKKKGDEIEQISVTIRIATPDFFTPSLNRYILSHLSRIHSSISPLFLQLLLLFLPLSIFLSLSTLYFSPISYFNFSLYSDNSTLPFTSPLFLTAYSLCVTPSLSFDFLYHSRCLLLSFLSLPRSHALSQFSLHRFSLTRFSLPRFLHSL